MPTDFDTVIDRRGTSCLKYDFAVERGYPQGILPFWVADMDFRTPQPVIEELTRRVQHGIFCRYFFRSGCGRHHQGCRHRDRLRR